MTKCPGYYCGRQLIANDENGTVWGPCGACPRSYRVNTSWACSECTDSPSVYDWMYISFMALLGRQLPKKQTLQSLMVYIFPFARSIVPVVLYWITSLDTSVYTEKSYNTHVCFAREPTVNFYNSSCSWALWTVVSEILHYCSTCWLVIGFTNISTELATDSNFDRYTVFHNPNPNYEEVLQCAQEAVYPLYSLVFVHYGLCVLMLLLLRPWVHKIFHVVDHEASRPIYAALYLFPTLTLIHGLAAGLICE